MFGTAIALDLLIGGQRLLARIPGPDDAFTALARVLTDRLNRPQRSARERWMRGLIVLLPLMPLGWWLGSLADRFVLSGSAGTAAAILFLLMTVRQRRTWEAAIKATQDDKPDGMADRHAPIRRAIEQLAFRFGETLVANAFLFALGGFALLLPFRLAAAFMAAGDAQGTSRPEGAFFAPPSLMFNLLSLPGAILAAALMAAAQIVVPGSNLLAVRGLFVPARGRLPVRLWPLAVLAHGLGLAFESRRPTRAGKTVWIGPKEGRARLTGADVRQAGKAVMAAGTLLVILAAMAASLYLTRRF